MSARTLVSVIAVLIAGCATVPQIVREAPSIPTPTCMGAADCEAKWSAARSYLLSHASYKIQNDSVDRLETYNPSNEVTVGLRAQVSKAIQPDGSYAIVAKFWCNNLIECSPNAGKTLEDFNRTVAAATSGGAVPPQLVVANQSPAAIKGNENKGGEKAPQVDAEKYIKDSEAAWAESMSTNDASVVKRILADDCVWILEGRATDKAGAIAAAAKGPGDFISNHLDYATVHLFGDTAIVQGSDTWTRRGDKTGHFIWTDTWIRRNGQWQIVAAQDTVTPIPTPGP
jgi:ketosteroid isomerase-like protein